MRWAAAMLASLAMLAGKGLGQGDPADAKKVPIYLSDFELSSVPSGKPNPRAAAATPPAENGQTANLIYADTDSAPAQARRLVDAFANMLLESFQKRGYTASRLADSPPTEGVLLRGVFAEIDSKNRIRRAILGAGAPGPTFTLYVAVFNLTHQDQPLYQAAPVQSPDAYYGPVISLNAYLPMMKFELPKNPSEEDVRKICRQIVSQLTELLVANPNAVAE